MLERMIGTSSDLSILQMSLRAILVFALTLILLRLSGRRSLGHRNAFDLCITVLLGAVLSRAIVGASPFLPTLCAGAIIVLLHRAIALLSIWSISFEKIVSGSVRILVENGRVNRHQMLAGLISNTDLLEAINKKTGQPELCSAEKIVLERNGEITVTPAKSNSP
ncbi:MAG: YetF domain-containing protein [Collimonas pratensis]|uniref:DUF421 domain-containing protein n=1 Tax=Collimonas pratensis TaxID=279113 RepID=UPI003C7872A6